MKDIFRSLGLGGVFVTMSFTFPLLGIIACQFCLYHRSFPEDARRIKAMVYIVLILEIARTHACAVMIDAYLVQWHAMGNDVDFIYWTPGLVAILQNTSVTIVQCFYIWRIWTFSERAYRVLVIPLVPISRRTHCQCHIAGLTQLCGGERRSDHRKPLRRRRTGACGTEYIIRTIMIYSVNMGAITMAASVAALLAFVLDKSSLYGGIVELQCRLFAISLLANLNARRTMRDNQPRDAVEFYPHNFTGDAAQGSSRLSPGGPQRQLIPKLLHNPSQ
ncbi:uncharacterized protein B0H18DRAFT_151372 [Fomitopsis serialis]|uniref:uncharacterized protein n=1 Tax=Fomitopsis serialis TaxID=139415 RepID=UPI0020082FF7|nr:uncharacterized protein B0H18DRAFT_151372 [Neoantrodia serialis]KAH9914010.1 hypothetical protein B0H18DRAFT_151372 [Neoantrodia serialis]